MLRSSALIAAALVVTVGVAGCSTEESGAANQVSRDFPEGLSLEPGQGSSAVWTDEGKRFVIAVNGSSSCPGVASAVNLVAANELEIEFTAPTEGPCTADRVPWAYEFDLPEGATGRPLTIVVHFDHSDSTHRYTLD